MTITITQERPDTPDGTALINELQEHLAALYPPASQHGFSIQRLIDEQVAFYVLRLEGMAAACGGVKLYPEYGEIKRVFVRPQYRGRGLSKQMMACLETHTAAHGLKLMRLETGIYQPEAISLYEHLGYYAVPPFGEYVFDPLSLYYEKLLSA